ncbi:hypothetical protein [Vibrio cholerae]|uniref:Uncharacterized protein n=1 Tax=Vibrio cholerae TaxID=666 RepID=A0ABD7SU12_VIBCL|nr:hypothetical protein [Vibrio cholerae]MCD6704319.1 hypothetical protein [Vibrio cholerae]TXX67474.1 hypothetical protein FXF03_00455 [Vibrio cholerae]GIB04719.1 hypothetical protein VCSRO136_3683 [Vibrio cholerae]
MAIRSSVSSTISENIIWINSSDFDSTVKAVKIHEILVDEIGYTDSLTLEQSDYGRGISIAVCDSSATVKQMREDYAYAKKEEKGRLTTNYHRDIAKQYLEAFYTI